MTCWCLKHYLYIFFLNIVHIFPVTKILAKTSTQNLFSAHMCVYDNRMARTWSLEIELGTFHVNPYFPSCKRQPLILPSLFPAVDIRLYAQRTSREPPFFASRIAIVASRLQILIIILNVTSFWRIQAWVLMMKGQVLSHCLNSSAVFTEILTK